MAKVDLTDILQLPVADRITVVQQIWDSVAADADTETVPITPEQREELRRRLEEHERNPDDVVEWGEVEREIRTRLNER